MRRRDIAVGMRNRDRSDCCGLSRSRGPQSLPELLPKTVRIRCRVFGIALSGLGLKPCLAGLVSAPVITSAPLIGWVSPPAGWLLQLSDSTSSSCYSQKNSGPVLHVK